MSEMTNTEKDPKEWVTGDEKMTGAQASYLQTLSQEADEPFPGTIQRAQAAEKGSQRDAKDVSFHDGHRVSTVRLSQSPVRTPSRGSAHGLALRPCRTLRKRHRCETQGGGAITAGALPHGNAGKSGLA